jgi:3D (Asp-Asp-Asp) domain-containing protein
MRKEGTMNFRKQTALLVTTFLLMIIGAGTAFASTNAGRIDGAYGSHLYGWAWDSSAPDTAAEVQIYVKNTADGSIVSQQTATADVYREDLASQGIGDGSHGFAVTLDWDCAQDTEYMIEARLGDTVLPGTYYYKNGTYSTVSFSVVTTANLEGCELVSLGSYKATAYCPCSSCTAGGGRHTASGAIASANHTVAVDPRVIPFGSKLLINGIVYTAEDEGSGVKGNHIDIFFDTHSIARSFGVRNVQVYLIKEV